MTIAVAAPVMQTTPRLRRQASLVSAGTPPKLTGVKSASHVEQETTPQAKSGTSTFKFKWLPFLTSIDYRVLTTITGLAFIIRLFVLDHPSVVMYHE